MNFTLNEIARALGGEISNGSVLAPGPNHKPTDRSLSVTLSTTSPDGFVVNTFSPRDNVIDCKDYVRRRLGIEAFKPGQNNTNHRAANLNTRGASSIIAPPSKPVNKIEYSFIEPATGEFRYKKTRVEREDGSKTFYFEPKQRGGSAPLLYGGERINSAKGEKSSLTVFIVEGEKKVDELNKRGFLAVSGDSGANSQWTPEHGRLLSGFNIVLWPDSDDVGEKYVSGAAKVIKDANPETRIKIVRPFPSATPGEKGKDVCDWTGSNEDLRALVDGAQSYVTPGTGEGGKNKFKLEKFEDIKFEAKEEWLIKGILPKQGVAAVYGKPGSLKSFVASDIAFSTALNRDWAGRRGTGAPVVFIAAEGAAGFRKRKVGFEIFNKDLPSKVPFHLISNAPNLGTDKNDLDELIQAVESTGSNPGLIVIDTLAQTLNSADENGAGMVQFVANANALAVRFKCLVLVVHHNGLSDDKRMRGHSSLNGAMDAVILCERDPGALTANLTIQKLKDEVSGTYLAAKLERVIVGMDEDGDEVSTLVVASVEDAEPHSGANDARKKTNPSHRLLLDLVEQGTIDAGKVIRPWADGPEVKAAPAETVRQYYFERFPMEGVPPGEDEKTARRLHSEKIRKKLSRAIDGLIDAKVLVAATINGVNYLYNPSATCGQADVSKDTRPHPSAKSRLMASGQNGQTSANVRIRPQSATPQEIVEEEI